jgi:hypothetical protein
LAGNGATGNGATGYGATGNGTIGNGAGRQWRVDRAGSAVHAPSQ